MIRSAVFLSAHEYRVLMAELQGSRVEDPDYDPSFRQLDQVHPLRVKIATALSNGERVILCPDVLRSCIRPAERSRDRICARD